MVLGGGHDVEACVVGEHGKLAQLVQHLLIPLIVAADGPQALAIFQGSGHCGQDEEHELHGLPPSPVGVLTP